MALSRLRQAETAKEEVNLVQDAVQNLSGVLFGHERLVRVFGTKQQIVNGQSVSNMDLVIL